jgi:hypothetical protein
MVELFQLLDKQVYRFAGIGRWQVMQPLAELFDFE